MSPSMLLNCCIIDFCSPFPEVMDSTTNAIPKAVATTLNFNSGAITEGPELFRIFWAMKNASFTRLQVRTTVALFGTFLLAFSAQVFGQNITYLPAVARTGEYYPWVEGKSIAVVANATSLLPNGTHTVDHLISLGAEVREVWAPEHGFRGTQDAGEHVEDGKDPKTGIPIRSLYGKNKRPNLEWFDAVELVVYDIQDVGVRFYTYSTTLSYVLDACVEAGVPLMVLDRGNPNGHYVDGPILQPGFESMVGLHPIPVVHGLTMGEYAKMVYGERWMPAIKSDTFRDQFSTAGGLKVIPCQGYDHNNIFAEFQTPPSPNLRSLAAIAHYPSLCFFEGTPISCGRGTPEPFARFGAPWLPEQDYTFRFTPEPDHGSKYPKFQGDTCHGERLAPKNYQEIDWSYLFGTYSSWKELRPDGVDFFNAFFKKLAGSNALQQALESGKTASEWQETYRDANFENYLKRRSLYLIYSN